MHFHSIIKIFQQIPKITESYNNKNFAKFVSFFIIKYSDDNVGRPKPSQESWQNNGF